MSIDRRTLVVPSTTVATKGTLPGATSTICKRATDLILAVIVLILAAPVMLVVGFLLWLESPGHVIFAQTRLGLYGRRFTLYKFRKFPADWGSGGPGVTVANDSRLTKLGWFLERTKLDELPQLWNIVKGDMSFVGPRPESPRFADLFVGRYRILLDYVPGIVGPTQIAFRNESDLYPPDRDPENYYRCVLFPRKAERDIAYYRTAKLRDYFIWMISGVWVSIVGTINWKRIIRSYGQTILVDVLVFESGWMLVNLFRFSSFPREADFDSFIAGLWIFPVFFVAIALAGRCYGYPRRHFSIADGIRLLAVFSLAWTSGFLFLVGLTRHVSLYLAPMGWFVVFGLLILARVGFRIGAQRHRPTRGKQSPRVIIYGSDSGAVALANWIMNSSIDTTLLGFLDDNPEHRGQRIYGMPILGSERDLPTIRSIHGLHDIWLTFTPDRNKRQRLKVFCEQHHVKLVVFPELEPFKRFAREA